MSEAFCEGYFDRNKWLPKNNAALLQKEAAKFCEFCGQLHLAGALVDGERGFTHDFGKCWVGVEASGDVF